MSISERWTTKFQVKEKSWVFVPNEICREYGDLVRSEIEKKWNIPSYYYHLKKGGHIEALKSHINNYYFIHIDIKNFFGSINKSRITRNLKEYFGYKISREIAIESTVHCPNSSPFSKFILPFGFVQSPIIASLCLHKSRLGKQLDVLNSSDSISISVYMDDIIISSKNKKPLVLLLSKLYTIAEHSKLPLNKEKTEGPSREIISFNIELSYMLLKITKKRMEKFQEAYLKGNEKQKKGILGYISTVNIAQSAKLVREL